MGVVARCESSRNCGSQDPRKGWWRYQRSESHRDSVRGSNASAKANDARGWIIAFRTMCGPCLTDADPIIAATAIHEGLTAVTRDRNDYDKAGAVVINRQDI